MSSYYTGWRARFYNRRWRAFTHKTITAALSMIDLPALARLSEHQTVRVLDVACGTGVLLRSLANCLPGIELYGVDASAAMLAQAQRALQDIPHVYLARHSLTAANVTHLPLPAQQFELITCTNAFHNMKEPAMILRGLKTLLRPGGRIVLEDFSARPAPFPWPVIEWLAKRLDQGHVRAYTSQEAQFLCREAGLQVFAARSFVVNWLWHGWALALSTIEWE